mmetsp:Transcript_33221/g.53499  ORF Transcript_33221/g.53499 Transcript_33221/m.53499 type:complete len:204 (+) Transcript_33221:33-644(+)
MHRRPHTGGKQKPIRKKRKFEMGRPAAMTKLGGKRIHLVRGRGGNMKRRAMRLETGNFSWGSEVCTRKTRILDVTYNSSNNELLRTKTLVKGCIVQVDATPFRQWYETHYGCLVGTKRPKKKDEKEDEDVPKSKHVQAKLAGRAKTRVPLDPVLEDQFNSGRFFACVSSRPGQSGRCDGYILEGEELRFYKRQMDKKKGKKKE